MEEKYYTITQVAEMLNLHHKTIRNFINSGKLNASRMGKQWRITQEDLDLFVQSRESSERIEVSDSFTAIKQPENFTGGRCSVSSVVDLADITKNQYMRISNLLLAVMNSKEPAFHDASIHMKYYEGEQKMRIFLWGGLKFMEEMLSTVGLLAEEEKGEGE
nr:helix-turn-helix domain-containing protein [uncultured Clostridium sp.]